MRQYNRKAIDREDLDAELAKIQAKRMERAKKLQAKMGVGQ